MENTLQLGDRILVNRLVYRLRGIDRGDIVVFSGEAVGSPATTAPERPAGAGLGRPHWTSSGCPRRAPTTQAGDRPARRPRAVLRLGGPVTVNGVRYRRALPVSRRQPNSGVTSYSIVVPPGRLLVWGITGRGLRVTPAVTRRRLQTVCHPGERVVGRAFVNIWPRSVPRSADPFDVRQAARHAGAAGRPARGPTLRARPSGGWPPSRWPEPRRQVVPARPCSG